MYSRNFFIFHLEFDTPQDEKKTEVKTIQTYDSCQ